MRCDMDTVEFVAGNHNMLKNNSGPPYWVFDKYDQHFRGWIFFHFYFLSAILVKFRNIFEGPKIDALRKYWFSSLVWQNCSLFSCFWTSWSLRMRSPLSYFVWYIVFLQMVPCSPTCVWTTARLLFAGPHDSDHPNLDDDEDDGDVEDDEEEDIGDDSSSRHWWRWLGQSLRNARKLRDEPLNGETYMPTNEIAIPIVLRWWWWWRG